MRFGLFILCCALLGYGMFRPESPPELFEQSDKVMHLLAFGGLALSARLAFTRFSGLLLWPVLLLLAPVLEYSQHYFQPVREFSYGDMLANTLGVLLALLSWWVLCGLYRLWRARANY